MAEWPWGTFPPSDRGGLGSHLSLVLFFFYLKNMITFLNHFKAISELKNWETEMENYFANVLRTQIRQAFNTFFPEARTETDCHGHPDRLA